MRQEIKNPYTKDKGYRFGKYYTFVGWFVVYDYVEIYNGKTFSGMRWFCESKNRGERIYVETLIEARMIAILATDGVGFEKWDYELNRPGALVVRKGL